ncbi:MAG: hypothetical protein ACR2GN_00205 [Bacteroidia bacterium]
MNKASVLLTSLFLIVTLLTSTIGISMYQHICNAGGKIERSFSNDFGCCGTEDDDGCMAPVSATTTFAQNCCSLALNYLKTDLISVIKEVTADWNYVPVATLPFSNHTFITAENKAVWLFENDTSPPSGRDILVQIQSFLI